MKNIINYKGLELRFIFLFLSICTFSLAQTSYEKGKMLYKAKACYSCHGHKAEGMHTFPRLANRAKGFLAYKLKRFRSKKADTQAQEMMITYSVDLSDEDIEDLTTYLYEYTDEVMEESYDYSVDNYGDGGS